MSLEPSPRVIPLGISVPVHTHILPGMASHLGSLGSALPCDTMLDPHQPTGTTEPPLPPPGTRFQTWRARPIPTDTQEIIAYRHEAVDIFVATDAIGAELGGDLALTQSVLTETQKRLQAANDDITLLQEEVAALRNDLNHEMTTVRILNQALANATPASSHPKTQDLPAPPRFNGERSRLRHERIL